MQADSGTLDPSRLQDGGAILAVYWEIRAHMTADDGVGFGAEVRL